MVRTVLMLTETLMREAPTTSSSTSTSKTKSNSTSTSPNFSNSSNWTKTMEAGTCNSTIKSKVSIPSLFHTLWIKKGFKVHFNHSIWVIKKIWWFRISISSWLRWNKISNRELSQILIKVQVKILYSNLNFINPNNNN